MPPFLLILPRLKQSLHPIEVPLISPVLRVLLAIARPKLFPLAMALFAQELEIPIFLMLLSLWIVLTLLDLT